MKKILLLFLLCSLATMFSCKEDDAPQTKIEKYTKKEITFREFLKLEGNTPEVQKIQKYFQGNRSDVLNKGEDSLNWEIDTTRVNQIITSEITTYTFGIIEHDTIEGFRNVLVKKSEDLIQTYLIHYPDGVDFENHTTRRAIGEELEAEVWNKSQNQCFIVVIETVSCDSEECVYGWRLEEVPCGSIGGGGGGGTGDNGSGSDTGGGNGHEGGGGYPTDPIDNDSGGGVGSGGGGNNNEGIEQFINYLLTEDSPFLLLDFPCEQLPYWQAIYDHQVPQSVINKLNQIENDQTTPYYDWDIQSIETAKGAAVNLDYYSVTFDKMPKKPYPNQNQQFTPQEFLNHIRKNLNSFVNTDLSNFSPSTQTGHNETFLWNSNSPIGSIIHINIPPGNDGSVACTDYEININQFTHQMTDGHWMFTTLETPFAFFTDGLDGPHPVSGNRKFGLIQNQNGTFTFYTSGVDRVEGYIDRETLLELEESEAFEGAHQLWRSFQQGIKNYIQSNSSGLGVNNVIVPVPISIHPNWQVIRGVFNGTVSTTVLGCE